MVLPSVNNPLLPATNAQGGLHSAWAGDDQDWWDWYVSLADNGAEVPARRRAAATTTGVAATEAEVLAALEEPYALTDDHLAAFRRDGFVKLPAVLSPPVVAALAERLDALLVAEHGSDTDGRFLSLEQMWTHDRLMRAVALSPRLGDVAACLLGESAVRLYHDTALSKEPGCGRTPWHQDQDHFPLATRQICTAWFPVHPVPEWMGPLSFARGASVGERFGDIPLDLVGTSYDAEVTRRIGDHRIPVEDGPYAVGEVSFHSAACFHSAGRNHADGPRRALSTIYLADGARLVDQPTMLSGTWTDFAPGVRPGGPVASALNPIVGRSSGARSSG